MPASLLDRWEEALRDAYVRGALELADFEHDLALVLAGREPERARRLGISPDLSNRGVA
jgi:hypothetical protein